MGHPYAHVVDHCLRSPLGCAVEPIRGRDGLWGASVVADDKYFFVPRKDGWDDFAADLLHKVERVYCWDMRRMLDWPLTDERPLIDVKSIMGGEKNFQRVATEHLLNGNSDFWRRVVDLEDRMAAQGKALKQAKIELSASMAAPVELIREWTKARTHAIYVLGTFAEVASDQRGYFLGEYEEHWPFIRALREIERNGIRVDVPFIQNELRSWSPDQANKAALRSMDGLQRDGYVFSLCNPLGGKTGRVRHEGGFNSMAIPHGAARDAIISRHEGGVIASFDFNAIDYRCIVNSVGGDVMRLYEGAQDFHERTTSFIFKEFSQPRRTAVKFLSYIYIYGGSEGTLVEKTGWTAEQVKAVLELLDKKIAPIKEFRESLWMQAQESGVIEIPGGRRVYVEKDVSPGKVIGLYAQSYSSWVFERAVTRVQRMLRGRKSKVIFLVHDEVVIDMHPDDFGLVEDIRAAMQQGGHVVSIEKGRTYGQLE